MDYESQKSIKNTGEAAYLEKSSSSRKVAEGRSGGEAEKSSTVCEMLTVAAEVHCTTAGSSETGQTALTFRDFLFLMTTTFFTPESFLFPVVPALASLACLKLGTFPCRTFVLTLDSPGTATILNLRGHPLAQFHRPFHLTSVASSTGLVIRRELHLALILCSMALWPSTDMSDEI